MNEFTIKELCEMALQFERMGNYKSADIIDNIMVRTAAGIPGTTSPQSGAMPGYSPQPIIPKKTRTPRSPRTKVAPPLKSNPVLDMGNRALGIGGSPAGSAPTINNPVPSSRPWLTNTWDMFGGNQIGQSPTNPEISKSWGQGNTRIQRPSPIQVPGGKPVYNRPTTQPITSHPAASPARRKFTGPRNLPELTPEELFNESSTRMTRMTDPALSKGTRMTKSLGEYAKNLGKNLKNVGTLGRVVSKATPFSGAIELAGRIPLGDMFNAEMSKMRMNNDLSNLSPERREWLMKNSPGIFQKNDPSEAFGEKGGWEGTYSDYFTGENSRQNLADMAAAAVSTPTLGVLDLPDLWGGTGLTSALKNYGSSLDEKRNQIKQQNVPQSQQMRQDSPHAQAQWTQDQLNQNISQKFQQMNQLSNDPSPQARARSNQLYKEIQWLRNNFSA